MSNVLGLSEILGLARALRYQEYESDVRALKTGGSAT
jgi:hypothetical protein